MKKIICLRFNVDDFCSIYKKHVDINDPIFIRFKEFISDEKQVQEMIFLNDEYHIPPADYFTRKNKDIIKQEIADDRNAKQYIGAYFGYLFKFVLKEMNYKAIPIKFTQKEQYVLSSASYFVKEK